MAGSSVAHIVANLDAQYPGLGAYITDERGARRKHVNIFVGGELIADPVHLSDRVDDGQTIFIMQALSGG